MEKLALLGGSPAILGAVPSELFSWPIVTEEDEAAVLDVLRRGAMSARDITEKFEAEFAAWQGRKYAIAYCNGTLSLQAAMFAAGLKAGDEMICPSKTYWASCLQAFNLGATVVFADIDRDTLCLDPADLERCIGPRTKAIMVVHYCGHPADMDLIMAIAKKHGLIVIEDVSHAQGGYYKGRKLGAIGDIAAMSMMSGKSLVAGEMGVLVTDNKQYYDRAMAYSHYERNNSKYISDGEMLKYSSMPLGGMKGRVNQTCAAMGRVQLKYYDERIAEIDRAMNYFWDLLEGVPGLRACRTKKGSGSTMAGWYSAHGIYNAEELGGLPLSVFCDAVKAEGFPISSGANRPLHTHPVFRNYDAFGLGKPTRIAFAERDVRELDVLPVTESIQVYSVPWFKKYMPEYIEMYANAYRKAAYGCKELIASGRAAKDEQGRWFFYRDKDE